ncbi:MAG: hypothetical protein HZC29_04165, partial [Thaumarchaeota archaeon]|nr:hypothetical protein [Nitrososphaerota archaeon]
NGAFIFTLTDSNTLTNSTATNISGSSGAYLFTLSNQSGVNVLANSTATKVLNNAFYFVTTGSNILTNSVVTDSLGSGTAVFAFINSNQSDGVNLLINSTAINNTGMTAFAFGYTNANVVINALSANNGAAFAFSYTNDTSFNVLTNITAANSTFGAFSFINTGQNVLTNITSYNSSGPGTNITASNTTITDAHYYNNNPDFLVSSTGPNALSLTNIVFDSPSGHFSQYTNLSLDDVVDSSYSINWTNQPTTLPPGHLSFRNKYVEITDLSSTTTIDTIIWHWNQNEAAPLGYDESKLQLWKYNSTDNWTLVNSTPDVPGNSLSLYSLAPSSTYAILHDGPLASSGDDGSTHSLSIDVAFSCSAGVITVTSSGSVQGATVKVDGNPVGTTNSSGQVPFSYVCGNSVTFTASKGGYPTTSTSQTLDCSQCAPIGCTTNADCPSTKQCVSNLCAAVSCPNGQVVKHN